MVQNVRALHQEQLAGNREILPKKVYPLRQMGGHRLRAHVGGVMGAPCQSAGGKVVGGHIAKALAAARWGAELARLQARQTELQGQHAIIEYRMARERDDALYAALSRQYQAIQADLAAVAESIRQQEAVEATVESRSPEAQVEGALALLDDVARITADPAARAEINPLLKRLGLWIGLQFRPLFLGGNRSGAEKFLDQVAIAEAVQAPVATEDGAEETLLVGMEQIQTATPTRAKRGRFADAVHLLGRGTRDIDHGERVEVTRVGGAGHRVIAVEVGHAFVHGTPAQCGAAPREDDSDEP